MSSQTEIFDGREVPSLIKDGLIFAKWRALPVGQSVELINDHDFERLHHQFSALWPETFTWHDLPKKPKEFRVGITKLKPLPDVLTARPLACSH